MGRGVEVGVWIWRQLLHYLTILDEGSLLGQDCIDFHGSERSKFVEPLVPYCFGFEIIREQRKTST